MRGIVAHARERFDLAQKQIPGRNLATDVRQTFRRRVCAVRGAEGVVHVHVTELGQLGDEGGVVLLLAGVEAQVLEQDRIAVAQLRDPRRDRGSDPNRCQLEAHVARDRGERVLRLGRGFRPAQVRGEHDAATAGAHELERLERRPDARVVRDHAFAEWHVQIRANEDALSCQREIRDRGQADLVAHSFEATRRARSTTRFA